MTLVFSLLNFPIMHTVGMCNKKPPPPGKASGRFGLPSLTVSLFGADGVVLVDPELVKGKKGEAGLWSSGNNGLGGAGTGRGHRKGREKWGLLPTCCPWCHPQDTGPAPSTAPCPHFSDGGEDSGKPGDRGGRRSKW